MKDNFICAVEIVMSVTDGYTYKSNIPTVHRTWANKKQAILEFTGSWRGYRLMPEIGTRLRTAVDQDGYVVAVLQLISVETLDDDE